ncbi:MAG TPA: hypothetical protein VGC35_10485 [Allosphingosinicella sp.]|jgi:hypothetical protein
MIHSLAVIALLVAPATAAAPQCVTKRQVADAAMVLTPYFVEAITETCRAHLPADSFLVAKGAALHARLKAESAGREASAGQMLLIAMGEDLPPLKDTESLARFMGSMAGSKIAGEIPVESCAEISSIMEALSPLPAENIGMLVASSAALADGGKTAGADGKPAKGLPKFKICKNG